MRSLIDHQLTILKKYSKPNWIELPAKRVANPENWDRAKKEEGARIIKAWPKGAFKVALDETGETLTSKGFASRLRPLVAAGRPLALAIGNHWGLDRAVLDSADWVWSLSPLTLPHEMCILCGLEQAFRGLSIVHGGSYHRDSSGG